jgi:hypothetical protein
MLSFFWSELIDASIVTVAAGTYTKGVYSPGAETVSATKLIAPQPVTANEKQMLPSGELERNYLKTWISVELTGWNTPDPDKLIISGKTYKIMSIDNRSTLGGYYKAIIYEEKANE